MHIRPYQIHNVLKAYIRQLSRSRISNGNDDSRSIGRNTMFVRGKRRAVIDKVAADIINRITRVSLDNENTHKISDERQYELVNRVEYEETEFTYHTIDENNEKNTHTFTLK